MPKQDLQETPKSRIETIITMTSAIEQFWRASHGWAPPEAADLLASARLDRQTSFTHILHDSLTPFSPEECEARLILGYVSLRSLCEGMLKLWLAVWSQNYTADTDAFRDRRGNVIPPEDLGLDRLIVFYVTKEGGRDQTFLRRVQRRGNAIHHFKDRDVGTQAELISDIIEFSEFLHTISSSLPYPDDCYDPRQV